MKHLNIWSSLLILLFCACNSTVQVPKPPVYPRINYPEKEYVLTQEDLPYQFEQPVYAELVSAGESKFSKNSDEKYWKNLNFLPFNATLHISYSSLESLKELDELREETRKLAFEHSFRADDIQTIVMSQKSNQLYGNMYLIEGNTATNLNFYLTDSAQHFFRAALYFNKKTKPDSILPVFKFVKDDIEHLINTFQWK